MSKITQLSKITGTVLVMTFSLSLLWAFLQPLYGSPDETAHVVKAVATASGQFSGKTSIGDFGFSSEIYEVPKAYSQGIQYLACILGPTHENASCVGPFATGRDRVPIASTASHYPPLYYLLVGPIGLVFSGSLGMYLMRVVSSLLTAIMLTAAFRTAFRFGGPLRSVGVAIACTPMVFSLSGAVNPHGLEIASSVLYWVTLLTCLDRIKADDQRIGERGLTIQLWVSGFFFSLVRPAGFVWMFLATVLIVGYVGVRNTQRILTMRRTNRKLFLSIPVSLLLSFAFYIMSGVGMSLGGSAATEKGSERVIDNLWTSFERADDYFRYMFGWFGWVEFAAPPAAFFICVGCLGIALAYSAVSGNRPEFRTTVQTLMLIVFSPVLLEGLKAASSGFGYQGRYTLALAVGLPILGFWRSISTLSSQVECRLVSLSLLGAFLPSLICIDFALKRYSVGENGPRFWFLDPNWLPPGGMPLICALLLIALTSFIMLNIYLRRSVRSDNLQI